MSDPPFVDRESGTLDLGQILTEAYTLAGLVVLFAGVAALPFLFAVLFAGSVLSLVFGLLGQLVLAVGAGVVLVYVVARGVQLADE
jgi:Na+/proline symporter